MSISMVVIPHFSKEGLSWLLMTAFLKYPLKIDFFKID